jgi:hypothetical protein
LAPSRPLSRPDGLAVRQSFSPINSLHAIRSVLRTFGCAKFLSQFPKPLKSQAAQILSSLPQQLKSPVGGEGARMTNFECRIRDKLKGEDKLRSSELAVRSSEFSSRIDAASGLVGKKTPLGEQILKLRADLLRNSRSNATANG